MQELEGVAWTHRWDYLLNNIPYTSSILGYVAGFLTLVLSVVFFILQCSLYRNVNVTTIYSQYSNDVSENVHDTTMIIMSLHSRVIANFIGRSYVMMCFVHLHISCYYQYQLVLDCTCSLQY